MANIILLTIDALRVDRLGMMRYERSLTPRLDHWIQKGTFFTYALAQSSHTPESMPALLSGKYTLPFGKHLQDDRQLVSDFFAAAGWQVVGFHANPYLSSRFGYDRGFSEFGDDLSKLQWLNSKVLRRVRRFLFDDRSLAYARNINKKAVDWFQHALKLQKDNFMWLHYMDVHSPYCSPPEYFDEISAEYVSCQAAKRIYREASEDPGSITNEEHNALIDAYDAGVRCIDQYIGELFDEIEKLSGWRDTLVVLTADHGEQFREHGQYGHPRQLYQEQIHVPLLFLGEGIAVGNLVEQPVAHVDVVPTLLEWAKLDLADKELSGSSLYSVIKNEKDPLQSIHVDGVISECSGEKLEEGTYRLALTKIPHKLILSFDDQGQIHHAEIYDLHNDPCEAVNLGEKYVEYDSLLSDLEEHIDRIRQRKFLETTAEQIDLDRELLERLQELGYME